MFLLISFSLSDRVIIPPYVSPNLVTISSLKLDVSDPANVGKPNNAIVFAVGNEFPTVPPTPCPPFGAITFTRGTTNAPITSSFNSLDVLLRTQFGIIWVYDALGEYCEQNGQPGYQPIELFPNSYDTLIRANTWNQGTYVMVSGNATDFVWTKLSDTSGTFTLFCRASGKTRLDSGINIGPYSMKCDVIINSTNYWSQNSTLVNNCSDSNRHLALLVYAAGVVVNTPDNSNITSRDTNGQSNIAFDDNKSFFKWKTTLYNEWNQTYGVSAFIAPASAAEVANAPSAFKSIKRVIYSFLSSKADGNIFTWDPEFAFDQGFVDSSSSVLFSFILAIIALLV